MVNINIFLKGSCFTNRMERTVWALINYAVSILLLVVLLFVQSRDANLLVAGLHVLVLISFLALLAVEQWDSTHMLALSYLLVASLFLLLYLTIQHAGVTFVYGAILILAGLVLFIVEIIAGWRSYRFLDRLVEGKKEEEPAIHEVTARPIERLVAKGGTNVFHQEECRMLQRAAVSDLIQFTSRDEAEALGLEPCKICLRNS